MIKCKKSTIALVLMAILTTSCGSEVTDSEGVTIDLEANSSDSGNTDNTVADDNADSAASDDNDDSAISDDDIADNDSAPSDSSPTNDVDIPDTGMSNDNDSDIKNGAISVPDSNTTTNDDNNTSPDNNTGGSLDNNANESSPETEVPDGTNTDSNTNNDTSIDVAAYSVGTEYIAGDIVSNLGSLYQCNIAGWCSSYASYFYEPGLGNAWQSAWTLIDEADLPSDESESSQGDNELDTESELEVDTTEPESESDNVSQTLGELCEDFNVYPNWTQNTHAIADDVMVYDNIAYSAKYYSSSIPGSDDSWEHYVNCDGTEKGTAALLSLPNPKDPVDLQVAGWPSDFVVASPSSSAPQTYVVNTINSADLTDITKLTDAFESLISIAVNADNESIIFGGDVLNNLSQDKGASLGTIPVREALQAALLVSGITKVSVDDINALSNDAKGWAQAQNLIASTLASNSTYGWSLPIGNFAYATHSGKRSIWDAVSKETADLLDNFELYKGLLGADFISFTKSEHSASFSNDQWHNALQYVKQVTDFIQAPAILSSVPTSQASTYFMGNTVSDSHIRKAAHNNIFAILFNEDTNELTAKIADYQEVAVPLYYVGSSAEVAPLTKVSSLNTELANLENVMDNDVFLYETPDLAWVPSTIYKWADFLTGLNSMHNVGVAGDKFWLTDVNATDEVNAMYAKVAIAAFLSQSMQETIRFDACDENNWSEVRYGAAVDYPMTASCGQLGQKYADYGVNPTSGLDHPYSCPRDNKMEQTATTHAKWYGAPAPIFTAPDAVLEEQGLLVAGKLGRWTNSGHCNEVPSAVDTSKEAFEREDCKVYVGQKAGSFVWDGSDDSVQGCGWWGRGVIQTTGRQNFGTLNHFVGRSHVDPSTVGTTIDGTTVEAAPESPLYADLDLCSNPGLVCSSEEHKEIKWIAGLFFWMNSVQAYNDEGGDYADWNYHTELKKYVDKGMIGTAFVDAVSGIVNRGCPDDHCPVSGEVHAIEERRANFKLVLQKLGLNPQ